MPSLDAAQLEVRVWFDYDVGLNQQIRKAGYRWSNPDKSWRRAVTADDFDMALVLEQAWARPAGNLRIEVVTESGEPVERWPT